MKRWTLILGLVGAWSLACMGEVQPPEPPPPAEATPPADPADASPVQEALPVVVLDALVGTSGDAGALVDSKEGTAWKPYGDPVGEGILIRFAEPTSLDHFQLLPCDSAAKATLRLYVDGTLAELTYPFGAGEGVVWGPELKRPVRSLFLKIESAEGPVCAVSMDARVAGLGPVTLAPHATVPGKIEVSSTLAPVDAYHKAYLFDRRTDFGWVEGADGLGKGETITLSFDEEVHASALEIHNGYQRSADHFAKNARVAGLALRVDGGQPVALAVADVQGAQRVELPQPMSGERWELEITQVTPGTRYEDLVISELRLVEGERAYGLRTADLAMRQKDLLKSLSGQALGGIVDRHLVSLCGAALDRTASLKLRSNQSFVHYQQTLGPDGDTSEVFDGAWVAAELGAPWSTLELYGRRHRIATEWQPYTGDARVESTRVSGGSVQVARVQDLGPAGYAALLGSDLPAVCPTFEAVAQRDAVVVKGKALTDVLGAPAP